MSTRQRVDLGLVGCGATRKVHLRYAVESLACRDFSGNMALSLKKS